jgi:hypothetical protein
VLAGRDSETSVISTVITVRGAASRCAAAVREPGLAKPGSTDDIEGRQAFSQVKPRFPLPGGCTYQVRS